LEEVKIFIKTNGRLPKYIKNDETKERYYSEWLNKQSIKYEKIDEMKDGEMKNALVDFFNEFQNYTINKVKVSDKNNFFYKTLEEVKIFIKTNGRLPKYIKNNETKERNYAEWISKQNKKYEKIDEMKDGEMKNALVNFFNEYGNYTVNIVKASEKFNNSFYKNFEELKKYIDKNKKLPSSKGNNEESKKLGRFLDNEKRYYKNVERHMKEKIKYDLFTDFYKQYEIYFIK
jgi:arsenate reductase-like glutaredoxin family protein